MPSRVLIADSYYLFDFLEISEEDLRKTIQEHGHGSSFAASRLIEYWVDRIGKIEKGQQVFIVFDLSDQYISGLLLKKTKRGFQTTGVYTNEICGGVSYSNLDQALNGVSLKQNNESEWLIGEDALFTGLNWSISQLS